MNSKIILTWALFFVATIGIPAQASIQDSQLDCSRRQLSTQELLQGYLAYKIASNRNPDSQRSSELRDEANICAKKITTRFEMIQRSGLSKAIYTDYVQELIEMNRISQSPVTAVPLFELLATLQTEWESNYSARYALQQRKAASNRSMITASLIGLAQSSEILAEPKVLKRLPALFSSFNSAFVTPARKTLIADLIAGQLSDQEFKDIPPAPAELIVLSFPKLDSRMSAAEDRAAQRQKVSTIAAMGVSGAILKMGASKLKSTPMTLRKKAILSSLIFGASIYSYQVSNQLSSEGLAKLSVTELESTLIQLLNQLRGFKLTADNRLKLLSLARYTLDVALVLESERHSEFYRQLDSDQKPVLEITRNDAAHVVRNFIERTVGDTRIRLKNRGPLTEDDAQLILGTVAKEIDSKIPNGLAYEISQSYAIQARTKAKSRLESLDVILKLCDSEDNAYKTRLNRSMGLEPNGYGKIQSLSKNTGEFLLQISSVMRDFDERNQGMDDSLNLWRLTNFSLMDRLTSMIPLYQEVKK